MNENRDRNVVGWALLPDEAAPEWGFDGSAEAIRAASLFPSEADELTEQLYAAKNPWTRVHAVVPQFDRNEDGTVEGRLVPWPASISGGGLLGRRNDEAPNSARFLDTQYRRLKKALAA